MLKYTIKRLLVFIPMMIAISLIAFIISINAPGDPVDRLTKAAGNEGGAEETGAAKQDKEDKTISERKNGAGFGFKISTEIVAALVVGVFIGVIVDNYFNTKPFGLIIFFILGALAGFLNVYRVMRRIVKR